MKRIATTLACLGLLFGLAGNANARTVSLELIEDLGPQVQLFVVGIEMGTYVTGGIAVTASELNRSKIKKVLDCRSDTGKYIVSVVDATNKIQLWTAADTELGNGTDLTGEAVTCSILTGVQEN